MAVSEKAVSLISTVCALAKELESNLPNLAIHPQLLSSSLEAIIDKSIQAMNLLTFKPPHHPSSSCTHMAFGEPPRSPWQNFGAGGFTKSMDPLHAHAPSAGMGAYDLHMLLQHKMGVEGGVELGFDMASNCKDVGIGRQKGQAGIQYPEVLAFSGPVSELQGTDTPSSSVGGELAESSKKRKPEPSTYKKMVTAPHAANLETPPDDGFTWRKYGQKKILNSKFPRSYYRCTHKNFGCAAKKHVQRLDEDPHTYEVTYRGEHTCNTSIVPLIPGGGSWLSMGMEVGEKERKARAHPHVRVQGHAHDETSHVEFGKETETLAEDFADVIFNYGGNTNTLDAIFPSQKGK